MSTPTYHTAMPSHNSVKWPGLILLALIYLLYVPIITAPIGFVISAFKVYGFKRSVERSAGPPDQEALLIATHHEWLVRTFVFMAVMAMAAAGLAYYIVGYIIAGLAAACWLYRLIRGDMALIAYKSMPATICTQALCYGPVASV